MYNMCNDKKPLYHILLLRALVRSITVWHPNPNPNISSYHCTNSRVVLWVMQAPVSDEKEN